MKYRATGEPEPTVDDINPALPQGLNYGNDGIFRYLTTGMGTAGFISSTVWFRLPGCAVSDL